MRWQAFRQSFVVLFLGISWVLGQSAIAETFRERHTGGVFLELEQYEWNESDQAGDFLRNDAGQRFNLGYVTDNLSWNHPGLIYEISGKGQFGIVYYRDSDPKGYLGVDSETLVSKSDYLGLNIRGSAGQRYGYLFEPYMLEVLAGLEVDAWGRNIRNGGDVAFAHGIKETFLMISPTISAGMSGWWWGRRHRLHLGLKYPLVVEQLNIDIVGSLQPQGLPSPFGHVELSRALDVFGYWWSLRLYFDSRLIQAAGPRRNYASDAVMQWNAGVRLTLDPH